MNKEESTYKTNDSSTNQSNQDEDDPKPPRFVLREADIRKCGQIGQDREEGGDGAVARTQGEEDDQEAPLAKGHLDGGPEGQAGGVRCSGSRRSRRLLPVQQDGRETCYGSQDGLNQQQCIDVIR